MSGVAPEAHIPHEYLIIVYHISDKQYQKRTWIKGESPGTDFDETVCQFPDIGDPILENYQDFGDYRQPISNSKEVPRCSRSFWEENGWPPKFIDTPEWNEITEMAKEVLKGFNYEGQQFKH